MLKTDAWQTALALVAGGSTSWQGVQPQQPFALGQPGWGALEVAARWSRLHVDGEGFDRWADAKSAAQTANSLSAGLHWHLSTLLRVFADFERTTFAGGDKTAAGQLADRPTERAVLSRVQLAW